MINEKFKNLKNKFWIHSANDVASILSTSPLTKSELKQAIAILIKSIESRNLVDSLNYLSVILIYDQAEFIELIKRKRIFKFDITLDNKFIILLINSLIKYKKELNLTEDTILYLQSKNNLSFLCSSILKITSEINKKLKSSPDSFVRDILTIPDILFYRRMKYAIPRDTAISDEDVCEACSFLTYNFLTQRHLDIIDKNSFSSESIIDVNNSEVHELIEKTILLKEFEKADMFLDVYQYQCKKEKNILTISSKDKIFEHARKYGYIHSDIQKITSIIKTTKKIGENKASFSDVIDKLFELKEDLFVLATHPIKRYTLKFPLFPELKEKINDNSLFIEEYHELMDSIKENPSKIDLAHFEIHKDLTYWDVLIAKRLFTILGGLIHKYLFSKVEEDSSNKYISYCSWIPVYLHNDIISLITYFIGESKARSFLEIYSWNINSDSIFDMQYTPLLQIGQQYYFPLNIFSGSNAFRNTLIKNKLRLQDSDNFDFVSNLIFNILKSKFDHVALEIKFNKYGFHGDFDVIAFVDDKLYIFESKNIINPAGLHELRTTYDNLNKGLSQLRKHRDALSDDRFMEYINKRLNWTITKDTEIVTCLVFSNRMFNGYTDGYSHVRSMHELAQFLGEGLITAKNNTLKLWENDTLSGSDMYNYIQKRSFHSKIFDSLEPVNDVCEFPSKQLIFESYQLNPEKFFDRLLTDYKIQ